MNEDGTFTSERRLPDSIETKVRSDSKSGFESSTDDDEDDDDIDDDVLANDGKSGKLWQPGDAPLLLYPFQVLSYVRKLIFVSINKCH